MKGREKNNEIEKKKGGKKKRMERLDVRGRMREKRNEYSEERVERKENKKILNRYTISIRTVSKLKGTVTCCKNLTHLTHLIKLRFLCLVCQMSNIIAFDTFKSSTVDAKIKRTVFMRGSRLTKLDRTVRS